MSTPFIGACLYCGKPVYVGKDCGSGCARSIASATFRIDDVSVNTDEVHLRCLVNVIRHHVPDAVIWAAISPIVHDMSKESKRDQERAFPRKLSAMSDYRNFYKASRAGLPDLPDGVRRASHGLMHIDHRLLSRDVQELSIVSSCSLVQASVFVPPFNKWNKDTESVCVEHGIGLVKFEDGWQHVNYNDFTPKHHLWYLHTHDTNTDKLAAWFKGA